MNFLTTTGLSALMFSLAMIIAIPGVLSFLRNQRREEEIERRLLRRRRNNQDDALQNESRIGKAVMGFADRARPEDSEEVSAVRDKLNKAGFTGAGAVSKYYFARLICVVVPQIGLFFMLPVLDGLPKFAPLGVSLGLVVFGLAAPAIFLDRRIGSRQDQCSAGFPDMMDLMVACVEAGLSLDASVQRVGEELVQRHPIIAEHMRTLSLELRAGRARRVAWRGFADRLGLEEAGSLATMLRQAEEMGTSLGETLRVFSADMRQRRILVAEEKAMALPAKMTLPLIIFVFPVLMGVLVLPTVVKMSSVMQ